jgi:hypothetical protein
MPINWYAALVIIVLVGVGSVALARYHYVKGTPSVSPTVGQTWHAALEVNICGTKEPALSATPAGGTSGLTAASGGLLLIAPKSSSEAGNNATLGKFGSEYTGMTLTNSTFKYPDSSVPAYRNGEKCASGTPDAGKVGVLRARTWTLAANSAQGKKIKLIGGTTTDKAASLKLKNAQLITLSFGPAKKTLPMVNALTEVALLQAIEGTGPVVTTTTTTAPATTSTTGSSTTSSSTTTTAPTTTTSTTKPSTTTTTK